MAMISSFVYDLQKLWPQLDLHSPYNKPWVLWICGLWCDLLFPIVCGISVAYYWCPRACGSHRICLLLPHLFVLHFFYFCIIFCVIFVPWLFKPSFVLLYLLDDLAMEWNLFNSLYPKQNVTDIRYFVNRLKRILICANGIDLFESFWHEFHANL